MTADEERAYQARVAAAMEAMEEEEDEDEDEGRGDDDDDDDDDDAVVNDFDPALTAAHAYLGAVDDARVSGGRHELARRVEEAIARGAVGRGAEETTRGHHGEARRREAERTRRRRRKC